MKTAARTATPSPTEIKRSQERVRDHLARTGLTIADFARRIDYSTTAIDHFLSDGFKGRVNPAHIMKAATAYIEAHPVGIPEFVQGDLYDTANVHIIRTTVQELLPRPVAYMLYAPPGSQKSFVLKHEIFRLNQEQVTENTGRRASYVYARSGIRPRDLMRRVAVACGVRVSNEIETMFANLRFDFRAHRVVLVIDEAQHLTLDCFEIIRELLDEPPYFSLLLAGSHDLKRKFDEFSPTLEQWNSRIIAKVRLPGLQLEEAHGIIEREIGNALQRISTEKSAALVADLIKKATVKDPFEGNRTYINIRTLTNSLNLIKERAA
jgi:DNA transposition AAA+ family ATPase